MQKAAFRNGAVLLFVRLSAKMRTQNANHFLKKQQFTAMVCIDDKYEVLHGLFKEPILGPLG